ncbi:MAG: hypothetical protein AUK35_03535 [Zetaproteobacteria bacterium CG2_30_46_52]|nr:MAG: hypothetical protein AUK35_03535 [Zetaproteobacteria bacterium CG2_30_46_52]
MKKIFPLMLASCVATAAMAATANGEPSAMQPLFVTEKVDMIYPNVAGEFLVYAQQVNRKFQVIQLNRKTLNMTSNVEALNDRDTIRDGVALANGDIGYISNRLGYFTPWIASKNSQTSIGNGVFNSLLLPNHINATADASLWVFDASLEATRRSRIESQHSDGTLHTQLVGQKWRMYHEAYWAYKSGYEKTTTGVANKFWQPNLFIKKAGADGVVLLGEGFDGDISADGKSIVFVREDNGNFDIWTQNIDGSALTQLTSSPFADVEPSWSTDGKHIVFVSNRDSAGDVLQTSVYTLNVASKKIKRITFGENVTDGGPTWLDNNTIIFHSNRDPNAPETDTIGNWLLWTAPAK